MSQENRENNQPNIVVASWQALGNLRRRFINAPLNFAFQKVATFTQPARTRAWELVSPYILPIWNPISAAFHKYTAPIRARWAAFESDSPRAAKWTARFGKVLGVFYFFYLLFIFDFFGPVPTVDELRDVQTANASEVYTEDGVLIGRFFKENRKDVKFEELPPYLLNALVATEDERFWTHSGVDIRSLGRVFFKTILGGAESSGGGSTLPMQLAKNLYPRRPFWFLTTPLAKVRELIIASRLEKAFDKKELITLYLNTVPFGSNAFGVQVASRRFFNREPRELKVEEAAVLVGMLQANTTFNPIKNIQKSQVRRNIVLFQMKNSNFITPRQYDSLKVIPLTTSPNFQSDRGGLASYFREFLRGDLPKILKSADFPKKEDGTSYDIYKDGLKIYTTIDSKMQRYAEEAAESHMKLLQEKFDNHWKGEGLWTGDRIKIIDEGIRQSDRYQKLKASGWSESKIAQNFDTKIPTPYFTWSGEEERTISPRDSVKRANEILNVGLLALDPTNGHVKAWVGGNDYNFFQYDHVRARRQVGSTFKPIVYAQALRSGIRPCDSLPNELMTYPGGGGAPQPATFDEEKDKKNGWTPRNADADYGGHYSMEGALRMSVNVVTAHLMWRVGAEPVRQLAQLMGVTSDIPKDDLSIGLGTTDISLFDMARVYGTFANRGIRPEMVGVLKVTTRDGKVIKDYNLTADISKWQRILTIDQADMMNQMLRTVVEEGTASRLSAYGIDGNFGGKTGTTQSHADGWFIGFNPRLVVGSWVGAESPGIRFRTISEGQGASTALPVVGKFLQKVWQDPQYAGVKNAKFDVPSLAIKSLMDCPRAWGVEADNDSTEVGDEDPLSIDLDSAAVKKPAPLPTGVTTPPLLPTPPANKPPTALPPTPKPQLPPTPKPPLPNKPN
ncbi:MAG: hypothetical protein RL757_2238 [Bacteroidota bacterium]|jgi:penicillin-binding protein 1A